MARQSRSWVAEGRSLVPPHARRMIENNKSTVELYEMKHRNGLDAFNDIEQAAKKSKAEEKEKLKALESIPQIMEVIEKKKEQIRTYGKLHTDSGGDQTLGPHKVKSKLADFVSSLIDFSQRPPADSRCLQRRNALLGLDKISFDLHMIIDGSCPPFVRQGYRRAADSIRFNVPGDLRALENMKPLEYLRTHTRIDYVMRSSYTRRFKLFTRSRAAIENEIEGRDPNKDDLCKLQMALFHSVNHAFFNTIWKVNFALVDALVMSGENYQKMTLQDFIGVCALTERCYWRMFDAVNDERDEAIGCRGRLEFLDFSLVERRIDEMDLPVRMKILVKSLS